ncbi:MAG: hypothetical protein IT167_01645 [Bryobacterales bacterium]|nr:hypothetical protein [Bryobacterales bacterium]
MSTRRSWLLLLLSITAWAADKDKRFQVEPAASYPTRQSSEGLTIAAVPYTTPEQMKSAFGKLDLSAYGVLPVLLVMRNDSGKTLSLRRMQITYVTPDRYRVDATPASDVQYIEGPRRPNFGGSPIPNPIPRKRKNKLASFEIEGYAMNAKMLPPGESAHGFVYFQTRHLKGAHVYIHGIVEAQTGKELLYFEIPLDQ